ncbi:MAG: hypothetical protein ACXACD_21170, partial [Candidatus Thorarchaeota archaeon]
VRSKDILELREREMKRVQIPITLHRRGNLRRLWTTAYGYDVLSALNPGLDVDRGLLDATRDAVASLGYELEITGSRGTVFPVKMTKELKKCIWWLAKANFTGRFK